jgi:Uma2 family endonuclease
MLIKPEVSEKEYFKFATEDISCELINGSLIIHSPASLDHEKIFIFLNTLINIYLGEAKQGQVLGSRFVMRLGRGFIFEPDLMVLLSNSRVRITSKYLDGPADMVVEILSPSTRETDLMKKVPQYLEKGVKEIWLIDPEAKELLSYRPNTPPTNYKGTDTVQSEVLKGFFIKLEWLWIPENFKPLECWNQIFKKV